MKGKIFLFLNILIMLVFVQCNNGSDFQDNEIKIPVAPTELKVERYPSSKNIFLSWKDNSDNETGFIIERSTNGNKFEVIEKIEADVTIYTEAVVSDNIQFDYRLRSFNSAGKSEFTDIVSKRVSNTVTVKIEKNIPTILNLPGSVELVIPPYILNEGTSITMIEAINEEHVSEDQIAQVVNPRGLILMKFVDFTLDNSSEINFDLEFLELKINYDSNIFSKINDMIAPMLKKASEKIELSDDLKNLSYSEEDLNVYFFDKVLGGWVPLENILNKELHSITVKTRSFGIYAIGFSIDNKFEIPVSQDKSVNKGSLDSNIGDKNILSNSIISGYGDNTSCPCPETVNGISEIGDYTLGCNGCSSVGELIDYSTFLTFTASCNTHDCCYNHGYATYGYTRVLGCDNNFLGNMVSACFSKFPLAKKHKFLFFTIWVPKPWNAPFRIHCNIAASITYAGVVIAGGGKNIPYAKQPCYDYLKRGTNCSIYIPTAIADSTSPTLGNNGVVEVSNVTTTSLDLSWELAEDDISKQDNLEYRVYYTDKGYLEEMSYLYKLSFWDSRTTVGKIYSRMFNNQGDYYYWEALGDWEKNINFKHVENLKEAAYYTFTVIVRDENRAFGDKDRYKNVNYYNELIVSTIDETAPPLVSENIIYPTGIRKSQVTCLDCSQGDTGWYLYLKGNLGRDNSSGCYRGTGDKAGYIYCAGGGVKTKTYISYENNINSVENIETNGVLFENFSLRENTIFYINRLYTDRSGNKSVDNMTNVKIPDFSPPIPGDNGKLVITNTGLKTLQVSWLDAEDIGSTVDDFEYKVIRIPNSDDKYSFILNTDNWNNFYNDQVVNKSDFYSGFEIYGNSYYEISEENIFNSSIQVNYDVDSIIENLTIDVDCYEVSDWIKDTSIEIIDPKDYSNQYVVFVRDRAGFFAVYPLSIQNVMPPVPGNNGEIRIISVTDHSIQIEIDEAEDSRKVFYRLYYSEEDNIQTVEDMKNNGIYFGSVKTTDWVKNLKTGTKYYINIMAEVSFNVEAAYTTASGSTLLDDTGPVPGENGNLNIVYLSNNVIAFNLVKAIDDFSPTEDLKYKAYYSKVNNINTVVDAKNNGTVNASYSSSDNSIRVSLRSLEETIKYYVTVIVEDIHGNETLYGVVNATTLDGTPPVFSSGETITFSDIKKLSVTVNWNRATDITTTEENLQYRVYFSQSTSYGFMYDIGEIERYLNSAGDWEYNIDKKIITSLDDSKLYDFYVIVKDEAGNKIAYQPNSVSTLDGTLPYFLPSVGEIWVSSLTNISYNLNWNHGYDKKTNYQLLEYRVYSSENQNIDTVENIEQLGTLLKDWTANLTQFSVTGLSDGNTTFYNVIVRDEAGNKRACVIKKVVTPDITDPVPGNLGILNIQNLTENSLSIVWTKANDNISVQDQLKYKVYRSSLNNIDTVELIERNGTQINDWSTDIDSLDISSLDNGTKYYFNVLTVDEAGNKGSYSVKEVITIDSDKPIVTDNGKIVFDSITQNSLKILWSSATDNSSEKENLQYRVFRSDSSNIDTVENINNNGVPVSDWSADITLFDDTGLTGGVTYFYNILVKDETGNLSSYTMASVKTLDVFNPIPGNSGMIITGVTTIDSITIGWIGASDDLTDKSNLEYLAYYSISNNIDTVDNIETNGTAVGNWTQDINTVVIANLDDCMKYYYNVVVRDLDGNKSAYSMSSSTTDDDIAPEPGGGGTLGVKNITATSLQLNWTKATDNFSPDESLEYKIYRSDSDNIDTVINAENNGVIVTDWIVNSDSFLITGLDVVTNYHFNVIVKDVAGNKTIYQTIAVKTEVVEMVFVEKGTFVMGSDDVGGYSESCSPEHTVEITKSYYLSKFEVTNKLWNKVADWANSNGYNIGRVEDWPDEYPKNDSRLVVSLLWVNALSEMTGLEPFYYSDINHSIIARDNDAFTEMLSGSNCINDYVKWNANGYRLPTEAEWEFAARNRGATPGDMFSGYVDSSTVLEDFASDNKHNVGLKNPNGLGIFDMTGNAFELVWDPFLEYSADYKIDPRGSCDGDQNIYRGGSTFKYSDSMKTSYRIKIVDYNAFAIGFRVLRVIE